MMNTRTIFEIVYPENCRPVSVFLIDQERLILEKIRAQLKNLQHRDYLLKPPTVKALKPKQNKGLFELRTRINKRMTRIIFCLDDEDNVILLHGFTKKQERDTAQELETARARKLALASGKAGVTIILRGGTL